jgi:non-specific serine/threonine protein kinase/serine/threonine-protein kinase
VTPWPQSSGSAAPQSKRARAVLDAALKRKPSERVAFIDGACADDEAMRDQVLDLLDESENQRGQSGPGLQLPQDRAGVIVGAALERRRNERLPFVEGACAADDALRVRALALLASVEAATPGTRILKPPSETPVAPAPVPPAAPPPEVPIVAAATPVETPSEPEPQTSEPTRIAPLPATPTPVESTKAVPPSTVWRPGQSMVGRRIGPYQLLHSIGKGGMGSVYAAARADQEYKKIVAIKLVTSGMGTEDMLRRFRNERQVLAGLDHPYIGRLLDGGSTEDGLPYLVMEFVEGLPIDRYCESHHLSLTERLKLFQKVCSAVQYAHQNLVVHRDIKPSNILVGTNGEPKLLDFGIARLMTAEFSAEDIELSRGEAQPMTLRYASPEQVRNEPITTESDIYSMGVLLYELVTGAHPFQDALTGRKEIEQAILTQTPENPSAVVLRRAETQSQDKKLHRESIKLARQLRGEIDPVLTMALAKQARGRYPSAESFSMDITRYLNGFPVSPRRDEVGYRARKSVRRHSLSFMAAAVVGVALIASSVVSYRSMQTARAERANAQSRFDDVRKLADFVLFKFDDAILSGTTEARRVLVTEALKYLDGLAKSAKGDGSLARDLILGYLKVGDLQGNPNYPNLGGSAAAKDSYLKALQVAESLSAKNPGDTEARQDIAKANLKLADIFSAGGDIPEALKRYRQAQHVFEMLASNDSKAKANLKFVTQRIGSIQLQQGDPGGALDSYRLYLQIAQELYQANPTDASARRSVALAFEKVGETLAQTGAVDEGLLKLGSARSLYEQIVTANPQIRSRMDVATVDAVIGDTLAAAGRKEDAVKSFRQALDITQKLVVEDPNDKEHKQHLLDVLVRLALTLNELGRRDQARQVTVQAFQILRPMVDGAEPGAYEIEQYCELLLTTPFKDLQAPALARQYAKQLVEMTKGKDAYTLDLLAQSDFATGNSTHAMETETKALALLPPNSVSDLKKKLETNLAKFSARPERKQAK